MAGKHNTKHYRSPSNYKERLRDRGLSRAPNMPTLEWLRKHQGADEKKFTTPNFKNQEAQGWAHKKKR